MSNYRTPWLQKASSLPSDRIASPRQAKAAPKGKQLQNDAAIPKSREVRRLEQLRDGLAGLGDSAPIRDPKGGCYCQGMSTRNTSFLSILIFQHSKGARALNIYTIVSQLWTDTLRSKSSSLRMSTLPSCLAHRSCTTLSYPIA